MVCRPWLRLTARCLLPVAGLAFRQLKCRNKDEKRTTSECEVSAAMAASMCCAFVLSVNSSIPIILQLPVVFRSI